MPKPKCGCHYWANQYAAGYSMCNRHAWLMQLVAEAQGITVQQAFDNALNEFFARLRKEAQ